MYQKRQLKELTIKDNFLFGAVMMEEENCRGLLERVLCFPIARVEVSREKSIVYHPEYKGIRLDVYAKDDRNTHYNIEMQVAARPELGKRVRYYHSQIDMELLLNGRDYTELPEVYVIFLCDFDPFGGKKYCYTFENRCLEGVEMGLQEGSKSIFLSTRGENEAEVSADLVRFLKFVKADLNESEKDFEDDFICRIQQTIRRIKGSRKMEERFMILEEMLRDERAEGREEGRAEGKAEAVIELLEEIGAVPETLRSRIMKEKDLEVLKRWHRLSARADSLEDFLEKM
ncbi:MAG: Rpn family recombination-promoting nuclease/putative transposase [Lachnospiraceae bacterium]|nr:Rpn family recombination-promoting nuclease/putative transposase [Lachnospiraceae bacterium]